MLELDSVNKCVGDFHLADVSLRIDRGEYFVLLGPTGGGKTVLLEIIAGLTKPDTGQVCWQGRDFTVLPPERRGFAMVYQTYALFDHMSVIANIAYGLCAGGLRRTEARQRARQVAVQMGIEHLLDRAPSTLSGGEKQRVALARALACQPQVLLLDEPLSALDFNVKSDLRQLLRQIHKDHDTVFVHVTHDPDEAIFLADRIGVMLDGHIRQIGSPEKVFNQPSDRKVAEFLALKNVLSVTRTPQGTWMAHGIEFSASGLDESVHNLWIRPEEILLSRQPFGSSARNQFEGRVVEWESSGVLLATRVAIGQLTLTALISRASFDSLGIDVGVEVYCTFKSSAVHGF